MAKDLKREQSGAPAKINRRQGRRKFIADMANYTGLTLIGGALWGSYLQTIKASPLVLRPPAALPEKDFIAACIKCGLCVAACKKRPNRGTRGTTLKLAQIGEEALIGTPYFVPREVPCYMCEDIPCAQACPTGALDTNTVCANSEGKKAKATELSRKDRLYGTDCEPQALDINQAKMGVAIIDKSSCVAYHNWGLQCDICYRECPLMDSAITLKYERNERTGKHAFLVPVVHEEACTGCGICEERCITEKPSISVLPTEIVLGQAGDHYQRGWLEEQGQRWQDKEKERASDKTIEREGLDRNREAGPNRSKEGTAQSYLNEGMDLD